MITIELTNEDAEAFKKFRKYQDFWQSIDSLKSGEVTVSIANNTVQWWEIKNRCYPHNDKIVQKKLDMV